MKTIFLAESERHVREALRLLLEQQTELTSTGEARSAESLLAQVCQSPPDLILLDWNLPGLHPQRLIPTLRACCPNALLIALSVKPEDEMSAQAYEVDGFISKQLQAEELLSRLQTICLKSNP